MSHPYQASVKSNDELQQGLFPSWHNRRHSHTSEQILENGSRKSGSFEVLKDLVKKQQDEDEKKKQENKLQQQADNPEVSSKIKSIVKDTTSGPAVVVHDMSNDGDNNTKETTALKKRPSVRFKEDNFIKN